MCFGCLGHFFKLFTFGSFSVSRLAVVVREVRRVEVLSHVRNLIDGKSIFLIPKAHGHPGVLRELTNSSPSIHLHSRHLTSLAPLTELVDVKIDEEVHKRRVRQRLEHGEDVLL